MSTTMTILSFLAAMGTVYLFTLFLARIIVWFTNYIGGREWK